MYMTPEVLNPLARLVQLKRRLKVLENIKSETDKISKVR
jgi:hypothetical protein